MSAPGTPNQPSGLWGSLTNVFSANSPAQAQQQQAFTTWASTSASALTGISPIYSGGMASTISYNTTQVWNPVLDAETAATLVTQFDEDHTLIDSKGRLKFGKYRHKRLCKADLEYIVALGRAVGKLRQAINKDIRQRRALARLTQ